MMSAMKTSMRLTSGVLAAGIAGLGYACLVEPNAYALRRFEIPALPRGSRPIKALHVSDMHLVPRQRRKIRWIQALADLKPDLVVNTGDNLADRFAVPTVLEALRPLMAYPGVFVMGSNDYFAPTVKNPARYLLPSRAPEPPRRSRALPTQDLTRALSAAGWVDLNNARGVLEVCGSTLDFVGVDDPHLEYDVYPPLPAHAAPADLKIGVTHAPYQRVLNAMSGECAELIIGGHTHGGQLCLPFYGALVTNCDLDRSRVKGLSRWWPGAGARPSSEAPNDACYLEVSAGLGTSPYSPVRFACRPEATLLTLVAESY